MILKQDSRIIFGYNFRKEKWICYSMHKIKYNIPEELSNADFLLYQLSMNGCAMRFSEANGDDISIIAEFDVNPFRFISDGQIISEFKKRNLQVPDTNKKQ